MPIALAVATLTANCTQCAALISNAHRLDAAGAFIFPQIDREQITEAGFLNLFVAWESFLESAFGHLMVGAATLSGALPVRYASPPGKDVALQMLTGTNRYFDFANHDFVRKMAGLYFQNGHPFEPHLSAIATDLADLRTMRNASAHISTTTQRALEALAQRIFGAPQPGVSLYTVLTRVDPRSATGNTVFAEASNKLLTTAQLIAQG
ncbi:hypothetical protein [Uliginosibacterium sp. H1]|uniref:hypothetical protein n=1 Tax=Uliginosibacterium sp. H1 TaxID=3114757 RepID=UPI002E16CE51|nr:hypothetical protein [Uliginosibacterium sp. H1]